MNLHRSIISFNFGSLYLVRFPRTSTYGSGFHYSRTIRFPQLSPLFLSSRFVCNCPRSLLRNSAVPYDMSRLRFSPHLLAASDSSPIRVRVLQQVRGSCSYILCPHRQFRFVRVFPVFFPRTQTGYKCVFLFFSLSQFYGCRNPRAPVFVVWSLFLFARAETQRRIIVEPTARGF